MARLVCMSHAERWEDAASEEPFFSALAHEAYLISNFRDRATEFFASGEEDVRNIVERALGMRQGRPIRSVLDFGCGPGRLLGPLLARGFAVSGVDLAPSMLARAREVAERAAPHAAELTDAEGFFAGRQQFDLIIVNRLLQHVPTEDGLRLLGRISARLATDGVLYLNVPLGLHRSWPAVVALRLRASIPMLNGLANVIKRRPWHVPVFPLYAYDLNEVIVALTQGSRDELLLLSREEGDLTTAHVTLHRQAETTADPIKISGATPVSPPPPTDVARPRPDRLIRPADIIAATTLAELNTRADEYFSRAGDLSEQLAKPFANVSDAPATLIALGVLLHGARLAPGMSVLDFGGGTGWLSRLIAQLGCHALLVDVSPAALQAAARFYEEHPPIGQRPGSLRTIVFDGLTLDVPSESVDRIVCFDSFHHVPNPAVVLAEFGRILRPGGLALFSEPGPEHSASAQSQFEMRTHGVLENDVDVAELWTSARELGFESITLAAFNGAPRYLSMGDFDDFLSGGPALGRVAREVRDFTANVRTFVLRKLGAERLDSRKAEGLSCHIEVETRETSHGQLGFSARITNTGTAVWLASSEAVGGVCLGVHLYDGDQLVDFDYVWRDLSEADIHPGSTVVIDGLFPHPRGERCRLEFDCVARGVRWFSQLGSAVATVCLR